MINEQLEMEQINGINICDNTDMKEGNDELEDRGNLIYKNRLKELVNEVAKYDGFEGIQFAKGGQERIQESSRYMISILTFEIVEQLKSSGRKQIKPDDVDKALDRILNKVSAIDNAILMMNKNIENLEKIRNNSITNKVNKFINNI